MPELTGLATTPSDDIVRVMLCIDHQANGAAPTVLEVLEDELFEAHNNLTNKNRFDILYDKRFEIHYNSSTNDAQTSTVSVGKVHKYVQFHKKLKLPIEFSGTGGLITEITSNNLFFLYISNTGLAGIENQSSRIRYDG